MKECKTKSIRKSWGILERCFEKKILDESLDQSLKKYFENTRRSHQTREKSMKISLKESWKESMKISREKFLKESRRNPKNNLE